MKKLVLVIMLLAVLLVACLTFTACTGPEGPQGETGQTGPQGPQGEAGPQGPAGISVTNAQINNKGELVITLSNGTTQNLGVIVGSDGEQGEVGPQGNPGQTGPQGKPGQDGEDGIDGITPQLKIGEENYWYVSYDNGATWENLGVKAAVHDGTAGLEFYPLNNTECAVAVGSARFMQNIVIPAKYLNYTVTTIIGQESLENGGFERCTNLTSITIPNTVTTIGEGAFYSCNSLKSIVIPDSVTTIGSYAFGGCTSLTSIVIPDSVTTIDLGAFYNCTSLTDVYYTGDIAGWCGISFENSSANPICFADNLYIDGKLVEDELVIPDSVTTIGSYAFSGCDSLTSIVIPDSVTTIDLGAFYNCTSLTSVTIGDRVTTIGSDAFQNCHRLVEVYNKSSLNITKGSMSNGCVGLFALNVYTKAGGGSKLSTDEDGYIIYTDVADKILMGHTGSKTDLIIPDGIKEIYKYAFFYCDSLTSITIPDSVTTIGSSAFSSCSSLTSIVIPDSVTTIGYSAFSGCTSLTDVYYTGTEEQWKAISIGAYNDPLTNATIHYNYVPEEN